MRGFVPRKERATAARNPLLIRCSSRRINPYKFQAEGRECGRRFASAKAYRSRADWIERARAAGWRVSPLAADKTVTATCPAHSRTLGEPK